MRWRNKKSGPRPRGLIRRFIKDREGVTAVEFALVGAPFLYLLCVIFETGLMLFSEYIIENGVSRASRMIRTGQVQINGMSSAQFKNEICGKLADFLDCKNKLHVDVRKFSNFSSISLPSAYNGNELSADVTTAAKFQPGVALDVVVVRAYYEWDLFVPGLSQLANLSGGRRSLTAGAAFRNEPYTT
ncbi:MAG: pilus assembly protein [Rhizobiales bacterium]|nr:pilus assembly protein [Hyphomicrobiales bacterium]